MWSKLIIELNGIIKPSNLTDDEQEEEGPQDIH